MNYYFLLEDEKSFLKVLPNWMEYVGLTCTRVADIRCVYDNNYVLQSGQGVTQLVTQALFDTIDTILNNPGKIDELVIILDSEESDADTRKQEVYDKIAEKYCIQELDFKIAVFVCNHCFETWLLGKKGLYPDKKVENTSDFYKYYNYYNIELRDPEKMTVPGDCDDSIGQYHFHYLHELLRYKKIRYRKSNPQNVATEEYFNGIVQRAFETEHIKSFREFYDYLVHQRNLNVNKTIIKDT